MNFIRSKRQSIRFFTPVLGLAAIATFGSFLGNNFFLSKYGIEPRDVFVLLLLPVSLAVGNIYCGWLCPAARVQTILYKLGALILGKKRQKNWNLPYTINGKLKYFRIILLIFWFAATALSVFGLLDSEISLFLKKASESVSFYCQSPLPLLRNNFSAEISALMVLFTVSTIK